MKRVLRLFLKGVPIAVVLFILLEFVVTNHLAGLGDNVNSIDQRIQDLQEENERLVIEIASASAMTTVASNASKLGFVQPTHILTITPGQSSVAIVPQR